MKKNLLSLHGRGTVLCLGGGDNHEHALVTQVFRALMTGNLVIVNTPESVTLVKILKDAFQRVGLYKRVFWIDSEEAENSIAGLGCSVVMYDGKGHLRRQYRQLLAARKGERVALLSSTSDTDRLMTEKVVSTDTTASGGNASLLALGEG